MFQTKVVEKSEHTFVFRYFSKNRAVYEIMWKNTAGSDGQWITV